MKDGRTYVTGTGQTIKNVHDPAVMDWTADESGFSNSSAKFLELCDAVECLIRGDARALIAGNADRTARLIVAHLAHDHGLAPRTDLVLEMRRPCRLLTRSSVCDCGASVGEERCDRCPVTEAQFRCVLPKGHAKWHVWEDAWTFSENSKARTRAR